MTTDHVLIVGQMPFQLATRFLVLDKTALHAHLRLAGDVLIYTGLTLLAFAIPALAFMLWAMSLLSQLDPAYGYLLVAWVVSLLVFILGVLCRKLSNDDDA